MNVNDKSLLNQSQQLNFPYISANFYKINEILTDRIFFFSLKGNLIINTVESKTTLKNDFTYAENFSEQKYGLMIKGRNMGIKEREIIAIIIERFKQSETYQLKRGEYLVLTSKIKSHAILQLIKELEKLETEKSMLEFEYICLKALNAQCENNSIAQPSYEEFDFDSLNHNFNYSRTAQLIFELKQKIIKSYRAVNNFQNIDVANGIFQIYDNMIHELYRLIYLHANDAISAEKDKTTQSICDNSDLSMISIGRKMHYCRKALNYTQKEMGIMFNLDRTIISNYENGKYPPSLSFIIQFAKYLDINLEDLCYIDFDIKMFEIKYPPTHFIKNAG